MKLIKTRTVTQLQSFSAAGTLPCAAVTSGGQGQVPTASEELGVMVAVSQMGKGWSRDFAHSVGHRAHTGCLETAS